MLGQDRSNEEFVHCSEPVLIPSQCIGIAQDRDVCVKAVEKYWVVLGSRGALKLGRSLGCVR